MKRILITGANSYIGASFESYIKQWPDEYQVDTVNMIDGTWRNRNFTEYESVFHVAGIAHIKETKENAHLYYEINRDLAVDTAKKAKAARVKQFIYLSSMSVYGKETGVISKQTIPNPKSNYGKSKMQAEEIIKAMKSPDFKVAILRPPIVYGEGCKGNFQSVIKIVRKSPVFPSIHNKRSMLYIDNLCAYVKLLIDKDSNGIFFPQNKVYADISHMVELIAKRLGKKIYLSMVAGWCARLLSLFLPAAKKAFGSLVYDLPDEFNYSYCVLGLDESIAKSVK